MSVVENSNHQDKSFWLSNYGMYVPNRPLYSSLKADVTIIGGGFTGLNSAIEFKKDNPNATVVVIESELIGFGASGRNAGFSTKLFGLEPALVKLRWGKEKVLEAHRYLTKAVKYTQNLIADNKLDCSYEDTALVRVSYSKSQLNRMYDDYELFDQLGISDDLTLIDKDYLSERFLTDRFIGGVYENCIGLIDPCKQVRELKRLAESLGIHVYENTPALHIDNSQAKISVLTPNGELKTEKLVLATNGYTHKVPSLRKVRNKQSPLWTYQVVTERLTKKQWDSIGWANREAFGDNRQLLHYFRPTPDGRIIMGGGDALTYNSSSMNFDTSLSSWEHCEAHLKWIYPQLKNVKVYQKWGGPVSVNMDLVPEIGFISDERIIYSGGCFGHGVALSHLNGKTIADLLSEKKTMLSNFWIVNRTALPMPGQFISFLGGQVARKGLKAWDRWEERELSK